MANATPLDPDNTELSPPSTMDASASFNTNDAPEELERARRSIIIVDCPWQVNISRRRGTDKNMGPYKLFRQYYGTYTIQAGTISGHNWYLKGGQAIWYNGTKGQWIVGHTGDKGTSTGVFYTNDYHYCPNGPGYTWKYFVRAIESWVDAGQSMSIWS